MKPNLTVKGLIVGGLILLMCIPEAFIQNLVQERQQRKSEVTGEVEAKWGSNQTLTGPILAVPYIDHFLDEQQRPMIMRKVAYFLPERLRIEAVASPEVRHRSIYNVVVYMSRLHLEGDFDPLPLGDLHIAPQDLFTIDLTLRGSENLSFVPVGKTTQVTMSSSWKAPSFDGSFLPNTYDISASGFKADWTVLQLNRNFPQAWSGTQYDLKSSAFGVDLLLVADAYSQTSRSVKYALLFVGLTFALYFFVEVFQRRNAHPLQYVLVGLALAIFYTLLLSISEYLGFTPAYVIAAIATVALIAAYTGSVFRKGSVGWFFGGVLALLYGYIYVLIQLEDEALLFGSIGLFLILATVMYYSRKIDWHRPASSEDLAVAQNPGTRA